MGKRKEDQKNELGYALQNRKKISATEKKLLEKARNHLVNAAFFLRLGEEGESVEEKSPKSNRKSREG